MPRKPIRGGEELLTPAEVARAFKVYPQTVTRWANEGKLDTIRTPGNQRRFRASQVAALLHPPSPR